MLLSQLQNKNLKKLYKLKSNTETDQPSTNNAILCNIKQFL